MRCDECTFENFADAEFCAECGKGIAGVPSYGSLDAEPISIRFAEDDPDLAPPPPPPPPPAAPPVEAPADDFSFEPAPIVPPPAPAESNAFAAPAEFAIRGPAPREPAPREPAPREPAPREPAPAEFAIREPSPREPAPREPSPREPAPREPSPREPAPREPSPREPSPREPAPREPSPRKPSPASLQELSSAPSFEPSPMRFSSPAAETASLEPSPFTRFAGQTVAATTATAVGPARRSATTCSLCMEQVDGSQMRSTGSIAHCPECAPYVRHQLAVTRENTRESRRSSTPDERPAPTFGGSNGGGSPPSPAAMPNYAPPDFRPAALREANPSDSLGRIGVGPKSGGFPFMPILIVLLVAGGAFGLWHVLARDRIDKLLGAAEASDDQFELRARYEVGDSYRYRLDVHMEITGAAQGITLGLNADIGANLYQDVLGVDSEGVGDLQVSFDSIHASVDFNVNGQKQSLPDATPDPDQIFRSSYDARGRLVDDGGDRGMTGTPIYGQGLAVFPEGPVRVGDTWTNSMDLSMGEASGLGGGPLSDMKFDVVYEVRGVANHRGKDCIVLEMNGEFDEEVDGIKFRLVLKGALFVDKEKGSVVTGAIDIEGSGGNSDGSMELVIATDLNQL